MSKLKLKSIDIVRNDYHNVEIPENMSQMIDGVIRQERQYQFKKKLRTQILGLASVLLIFVLSINMNQAFAISMRQVPVLGDLVKVLIFRTYSVNDALYHVEIDIPVIEGLEDTDLQNRINEKYLEDSQLLYENFQRDMAELQAAGGGHLGVDSGFIVKTETDKLLSIGRYVVNTVGSSSTVMHYDTIDKENSFMLTLPSLFKTDDYVEIISENIIDQMRSQMAVDENIYYWVEDEAISNFTVIKADQNFYISDQGKLVIAFDKYEVAPGYMGLCEFEIPTEILTDYLVSSHYIH